MAVAGLALGLLLTALGLPHGARASPPLDPESIHNKYEGKTIVLIGSGPTLTEQGSFFREARQNGYALFANNHAALQPPANTFSPTDLDYFLISDPWEYDTYRSDFAALRIKSSGQKFCAFPDPYLRWNDKEKSYAGDTAEGKQFTKGFDSVDAFLDSNACQYVRQSGNQVAGLPAVHGDISSSSMFISFQMALWMAPKEIILVGADASGDKPFANVKRNIDYGSLVQQWRSAAAYAEKEFPGVRVTSVAPVGLKDLFPVHEPQPSSQSSQTAADAPYLSAPAFDRHPVSSAFAQNDGDANSMEEALENLEEDLAVMVDADADPDLM